MKNIIKFCSVLMLCFTSNVMAESLSLKSIMQGLNQNMQRVVDGVAREDWYQVTDAAEKIAHHPAPPMAEKKRIKASMGDKMKQFKTRDMTTHHAASALHEAALSEDGHKIIVAFAQLQETCLACHQAHRADFKQQVKTP